MTKLHNSNSWQNASKIAQPGQMSLFDDCLSVPVSDAAYAGLRKTCNRCRKHKPIAEFGYNAHARFQVDSACKLCVSAHHKNYYKANTIKMRLHMANNRARSLNIPGTLLEEDIAVLIAQSPLCAYCGSDYAELGVTWHIDHVIPLAEYKRGNVAATNTPQNVCVTCAFCNGAKRDYTVEQFKSWLRAVQSGPVIREVKAPYAA